MVAQTRCSAKGVGGVGAKAFVDMVVTNGPRHRLIPPSIAISLPNLSL